MDIASIEPKQLIIGDTWQWSRSLADYPASVWTLTYNVRGRTFEFDITATADGDNHAISVAAAVTATYQPGLMAWHATVSNGADRFTVGRGIFDIKADPSQTGAGLDPRSHNRKVLEALEAVMENRASSGQRELVAYTIGSRSKTFDAGETKAAVLEQIGKYRWLVANEEQRDQLAAGQANPRYIGIRFGR